MFKVKTSSTSSSTSSSQSEQQQQQKNNLKTTAVCAIGSQDAGISIWWTGIARAPLAATHLFSHSVLDMRWSPDGRQLVACSYDGGVQMLSFDDIDLGVRVGEEEKDALLSAVKFFF